MLIKICGVTTAADARMVADAGADMIGINFWPRSKRFVATATATSIASAARQARASIEVVGVFVNPTDAELAAADGAGLDWIQLHGDEDVARLSALGPRAFKAVSVTSADDVEGAMQLPGRMLLLDTPSPDYGGSGESFDWTLTAGLSKSPRPWLLAGGLNAENVGAAIAVASPDGVDVASGVEATPGVKDADQVRAFVDAVRRTE